MEENTEARNKPSYIYAQMPKSLKGKEQSLQQMVLGKLDTHMQKNEVGSLPNTLQKN